MEKILHGLGGELPFLLYSRDFISVAVLMILGYY